MKFLIVALCVACAAAGSSNEDAKVIRNDYELSPEGSYQSAYETDNGISGQATGLLKTVDKEQVLEVSGSNQYISPEGQSISLTYVADENGYHPVGAHLPTPPTPEAIPEYILRSLEYIRTHPYVEKKL